MRFPILFLAIDWTIVDFFAFAAKLRSRLSTDFTLWFLLNLWLDIWHGCFNFLVLRISWILWLIIIRYRVFIFHVLRLKISVSRRLGCEVSKVAAINSDSNWTVHEHLSLCIYNANKSLSWYLPNFFLVSSIILLESFTSHLLRSYLKSLWILSARAVVMNTKWLRTIIDLTVSDPTINTSCRIFGYLFNHVRKSNWNRNLILD